MKSKALKTLNLSEKFLRDIRALDELDNHKLDVIATWFSSLSGLDEFQEDDRVSEIADKTGVPLGQLMPVFSATFYVNAVAKKTGDTVTDFVSDLVEQKMVSPEAGKKLETLVQCLSNTPLWEDNPREILATYLNVFESVSTQRATFPIGSKELSAFLLKIAIDGPNDPDDISVVVLEKDIHNLLKALQDISKK